MISYTKNIFASKYTAFSNRDGKTCVQCRVLGRFGIIKIIFYPILTKNKFYRNFTKSFGNMVFCCNFVPGLMK